MSLCCFSSINYPRKNNSRRRSITARLPAPQPPASPCSWHAYSSRCQQVLGTHVFTVNHTPGNRGSGSPAMLAFGRLWKRGELSPMLQERLVHQAGTGSPLRVGKGSARTLGVKLPDEERGERGVISRSVRSSDQRDHRTEGKGERQRGGGEGGSHLLWIYGRAPSHVH